MRPPHLSEHSLEYRDIPVIQGEKELINCTVRAISDHEFKTRVYFEPFNASRTEEREEFEYKYLKKIITAHIDDSAAIDEQDMLCEIYEPIFAGHTISLTFKAYIIDPILVSKETCETCEGNVRMTIRRATTQKKEYVQGAGRQI